VNTEEILRRLDRVHKSGAGWVARCPAHEDRTPSLSITVENGKALLYCHAGCTLESIVGAAGMTVADLFLDNGHAAPQAHANAKANGSAAPQPFAGTDADVDRMQLDLAKSHNVQRYIESRGISLRVAGDLKWGAAMWRFRDSEDQWVEKLAVTFPHYCAGKLVGIKFKSADGTKLFSQMPGSSKDGVYALAHLDPGTADVLILEGPEDAALAISHGFQAVAINDARAKVLGTDVAALCRHKRLFVVGDQDVAGKRAMDELEQRLPAEQRIRVRLLGYKDIGDLWKSDPAGFDKRLRRILRFAQGSRDHFELPDLLDEEEISESHDGDGNSYAIEKLVPRNAISMFFGEEKSGKSLLSRYLGKSVANGLKVFRKYSTQCMPVLCFDLENDSQDLRAFTKLFGCLGPEKIRYRTRKTGVPPLDSPALLRFCERERPLLIIDSMTKFLNGIDPFHPGEMSIFFDKLLNLCAAGATIILIHHATRADVERYADSHQIGANVARAFAVVSEDRPRLNRVRLEGQLFRGDEPVTENLVAFPVIAERGEFGLSAETDPFAADLEALLAFVRSQPGEVCRKEAIKNRPGRRAAANLNLLDVAIKRGLLVVLEDKKISFPNAGTIQSEAIPFPSSGTDGNES
jgi:hypothetical protein